MKKFTPHHLTAIIKLCGNSGVRLRDALALEKRNFKLNKKIIYLKSNKFKNYNWRATILPKDVLWFKEWFKTFSGKLFPFEEQTVLYHLREQEGFYGTHDLRKQLVKKMMKKGATINMIHMKLGHLLDDKDHEIDENKLFKHLQAFEAKV